MSSGDKEEKRRLSDEEERARVQADTDAVRQQVNLFEEPPEVGVQELGEVFESPPLSDFYARAMRDSLFREDLRHYEDRKEFTARAAADDVAKDLVKFLFNTPSEEVFAIAEAFGKDRIGTILLRAKIELEEIEKLIKQRKDDHKASLRTF